MKTRIFTLAALAAALFAVSCVKDEPQNTPDEIISVKDQGFIFDFSVANTKASKSAWEAGDQILLFFNGDIALGHQLRMTYNGSCWVGEFDSDAFAATLKAGDAGYVSAVSTPYAIKLSDNYDRPDYALTIVNDEGGYVLAKDNAAYTIEAAGEKLRFCANLGALTSITTAHIAITDLVDENPANWTLSAVDAVELVEDYGWLGVGLYNCSRVFFDGSTIKKWNYNQPIAAYTNGDNKVCFSTAFKSIAKGNVVLLLTNKAEGKTYFRILPREAFYAGGSDFAANKLFKMSFNSFTLKTSNNDYLLHDTQGNFYTTVLMKDGKWWMADNIRTIPAGLTPCESLTNVAAGIYYPVAVSEGKTSFAKDYATIFKNGYLYQSETALGVAVNSLPTTSEAASSEAAKALEGCQGICPTGWHVPTISDITGLVGKAVSPITTNSSAPYYNGSYGSIALLNADGMKMDAFGAVSIGDNTKTAGTLMGGLASYPNNITSGYICGSSYASVGKNTDGTVKNIQFYGLMPMTNKADASAFTCNGAKLSYKIGASVRCVKNQ